MEDVFGSDFMTIIDEDGTEYELEVLSTIEYRNCTYLAVIPANGEDQGLDQLDVCILKSVDEDGESILVAVEDENELNAVNDLIMDQIYAEEDED